jgi:GNAT superfamily N-acetyltransferase
MSGHRFHLRVAQPGDADSVSAVLASAYPRLMGADYDPAVLDAVLPAVIVANPVLLASGNYYVVQATGGLIVSCGGWTHEEPGSGKIEHGVAHVRHFGTHADWIRQGLGRMIFAQCRKQALAVGVQCFRCFSSLGAEPFTGRLVFMCPDGRHLS